MGLGLGEWVRGQSFRSSADAPPPSTPVCPPPQELPQPLPELCRSLTTWARSIKSLAIGARTQTPVPVPLLEVGGWTEGSDPLMTGLVPFGNKPASCHSGNPRGFGSSVPGTGDKKQIHKVYYPTIPRVCFMERRT